MEARGGGSYLLETRINNHNFPLFCGGGVEARGGAWVVRDGAWEVCDGEWGLRGGARKRVRGLGRS